MKRKFIFFLTFSFIVLILCTNLPAKKTNTEYRFITEEYPPYNYIENGQLAGMFVDILREMLKIIGWEDIPVEVMDWNKAYDTALNEDNVIIFSINRIPERENKFKWVGPIATNYWNLYALKRIEGTNLEYNISNLNDAKKYSIGAQYKSSITDYLKNRGFENINYSTSLRQVMEKLLTFHTQLVAESEVALFYELKRLWLPVNKIQCVYRLEHTDLYIAFNKHIPDEIVKKFQNALNQIKETGKYDKIVEKYYESKTSKLSYL